ncbi:MAG TPA: hypothetical protein VFQ44_06600 [Streptosporangiaceae bacterium]|nr:hypothetical protein [Streptosporangiaceae bacterium]
MKEILASAATAIGIVVTLVLAAAGEAASHLLGEEIKGRIEALPAIVLQTAAMYLSTDLLNMLMQSHLLFYEQETGYIK